MTFHQTILPDPNAAPLAPPRQFLSFVARILGNGRDSGGLHAVELLVPGRRALAPGTSIMRRTSGSM